ncbi:MAG: TldD/PmbA family protein [Clostridia bacterium]|nr:TldD/PmbA family protein [Clostridia bacterium]
MLNQATAQRVLEAAVSTGGDFGEIFLEDRVNHSVQMRSSKANLINSNRIHGAGIRVLRGTNAIYVYTNDTSEAGLLSCAKRAAQAISQSSRSICAPLVWHETPNIHAILIHPQQVKAPQRIEILRQADAAARAYSSEISQVSLRLADSVQKVWIANTEGLFTQDTRVYTRMACTAVASSGMENQMGVESPGGMMGYELFQSRVDPCIVGQEAARTAVTMLHAPVCPAGVMPVVIDNGFGGVIFHEACGHSLEATSVALGNSEFCGKLGQKIAAECVTAVDDGTLPNEWGSLNIDDEGAVTTRLTLIEKGVLKNYMIDKLGSRRMQMPPTGSSRRESYAYAPTSRMRNTFILPGQDDEEAMIRTMGDGLYARKMGGGSVNPATGEFNFAVAEGYLVKDGKILHPVRGASLIGKGSQVLMHIDRVGRNMRMAQGMCGSSSGSIPTNVGQPMIRVSSLTVGGRK